MTKRNVMIRMLTSRLELGGSLFEDEEEIDEEYTRLSEVYRVDLAKVKEMIAAEDIKADLLVGAAMKLVKENTKAKA